MTTQEFITAIANKTNMSSSVVEMFLEVTSDTMIDAFAADEDIAFPKLGTFSPKVREVCTEHSPTAEDVLDFESSSYLKEALTQ